MKKPKDSPKGYQKPVLSINAKSRDPSKTPKENIQE
jgi:hypothetical protein